MSARETDLEITESTLNKKEFNAQIREYVNSFVSKDDNQMKDEIHTRSLINVDRVLKNTLIEPQSCSKEGKMMGNCQSLLDSSEASTKDFYRNEVIDDFDKPPRDVKSDCEHFSSQDNISEDLSQESKPEQAHFKEEDTKNTSQTCCNSSREPQEAQIPHDLFTEKTDALDNTSKSKKETMDSQSTCIQSSFTSDVITSCNEAGVGPHLQQNAQCSANSVAEVITSCNETSDEPLSCYLQQQNRCNPPCCYTYYRSRCCNCCNRCYFYMCWEPRCNQTFQSECCDKRKPRDGIYDKKNDPKYATNIDTKAEMNINKSKRDRTWGKRRTINNGDPEQRYGDKAQNLECWYSENETPENTSSRNENTSWSRHEGNLRSKHEILENTSSRNENTSRSRHEDYVRSKHETSENTSSRNENTDRINKDKYAGHDHTQVNNKEDMDTQGRNKKYSYMYKTNSNGKKESESISVPLRWQDDESRATPINFNCREKLYNKWTQTRPSRYRKYQGVGDSTEYYTSKELETQKSPWCRYDQANERFTRKGQKRSTYSSPPGNYKRQAIFEQSTSSNESETQESWSECDRPNKRFEQKGRKRFINSNPPINLKRRAIFERSTTSSNESETQESWPECGRANKRFKRKGQKRFINSNPPINPKRRAIFERSTSSSNESETQGSWPECGRANKRFKRKGQRRILPKIERKRKFKPSVDEKYFNNAYLNYYVRLFRRETFRGLPASYVAQYAGMKWKQLTEMQKRPYYDMQKLAKTGKKRKGYF